MTALEGPEFAERTSRRGLTYGRRGTGPAIVLIHGWCLDRTVWMYLEESLLGAGHEVITPALAGYGASSNLAGPYTLCRHGSDIADLIDELALESATVVGFALGAAVLFDLENYRRVGALVFIGVPNAGGAPYPKMRTAMLKDWPLFAQRSARAICNQPHSDATLDWLEGIFVSTPLEAALAGVDLLGGFEPADRAQRWRAPSIFVHGRDDPIVSLDVSRECASRFSGADLVVVEDCGHFVVLDQRQRLHEVVVEAVHLAAVHRAAVHRAMAES